MPAWHAFVYGLGRHPAIVGYEPGYVRVTREQAAWGPLAHPEGMDDLVVDEEPAGELLQLPTRRGPR